MTSISVSPRTVSVRLPIAALALTLALGCAAEPPPAAQTAQAPTAPEGRLVAAADMPPAAHAELRKRMRSHSRQMNELVWAVVLVDYSATQKLAEALAADAELDEKAMGDAVDIAQGFPKGFFAMQASLRIKAADLARAAAVRDSKSVSSAYGGLSQVCVDCHAVYRGDRRDNPPSAN